MIDRSWFGRFARATSRAAGHPLGFALAALAIVVWAATGPLFRFGDTWQLVINTATTIVTLLMVFLIQHTQNRESAAVQLKLNELLRAVQGAHLALLDVERLTPRDLDRLLARYAELAEEGLAALRRGELDTDAGWEDPAAGMATEESSDRPARRTSRRRSRGEGRGGGR